MKNYKKVVSLALAGAMVLPSAAYAAEITIVENNDNISEFTIGDAADPNSGFTEAFDNAKDLSNIFFDLDTNGTAIKLADYMGEEGGIDQYETDNQNTSGVNLEDIVNPDDSEDLEVESISAINETSVTVNLNKDAEETLTTDFFTVDGANLNSIVEVTPSQYTLNIDSLDGTTGTVKVNGKSADYDYTSAGTDATVESVTIDNYRKLTVTFSDVVDTDSAEDPGNYYFEIIEGDAGKLGDNPDLSTQNSLANINANDDNLAADDNVEISSETVNGKTVVTINLPEGARFAGEDGVNLLEILEQSGSTTLKVLDEDTNVNVAVRNVKDASGERSLDTVVKEIKITDTNEPELVKVTDEDGNAVDLSNTVELKATDTQKLVFEFSEPIAVEDAFDDTIDGDGNVDDLNPKGSSVYLDGADADATQADLHGTGEGKYADAKEVTLELKQLIENNMDETYAKDETYNIKINGIKDLSDNLFTSTINFDLELLSTGVTETETPEILGVTQVLDNVFRVEANQEDVTGMFTIENGDGEDGTVSLPIPATREFTKTNGTKAYYSYVSVQAVDSDETGDIFAEDGSYNPGEGTDDSEEANDDVLSFDGNESVLKAVSVKDVALLSDGTEAEQTVTAIGEDYSPSGLMEIKKDMLAPEMLANSATVKYDAAADKIYIPFADQTPFENVDFGYDDDDEVNVGEDEVISEHQELVILNTDSSYSTDVRLKVDYTDENGQSKSLSSDETAVDGGASEGEFSIVQNSDSESVYYNDYQLEIDLGTLAITDFLNTDDSALREGATYTVELPDGLVSDQVLSDFNDSSDDTVTMTMAQNAPEADISEPAVGDTVTLADYAEFAEWVDTVGRDDGNGYTTNANTFTLNVGEKETSLEDGVPQTAKSLISYPAGTNELEIKFTGAPTEDSATDLNNYLLNGQSFASIGATDSHITYNDTSTGAAVNIEIPDETLSVTGDVVAKVQDVENEDGGKMTPVSVNIADMEDNTSPKFVDGEVTATKVLELTFDEKVNLAAGSTSSMAAKNFEVLNANNPITVTDASADGTDNKVVLTLSESIDQAESISVNVKLDQNNKMHIVDETENNKNELEVETITVE